jgi:hypothetical protein
MKKLNSGQDAIMAALLGLQNHRVRCSAVLELIQLDTYIRRIQWNRRVELRPERQCECVSSIHQSLEKKGVGLKEENLEIRDHDRHWGHQLISKTEGDFRLATKNIGNFPVTKMEPMNRTTLIAFKTMQIDVWAWRDVKIKWSKVVNTSGKAGAQIPQLPLGDDPSPWGR